MENNFTKLNAVNVNDHIENKNGLSYLSWPYAIAEIKKVFPDFNYRIVKNENGWNYHTDGKTCWVETECWINKGDEPTPMWLPVMDYRNKSIPLENVTSFDVNKSLMRCLVKGIAVTGGLGLYIYAGEDLPEEEKEKIKADKLKNAISKEEQTTLKAAFELAGYKDIKSLCSRYGFDSLEEFSPEAYKDAMERLKK